MPPQEIEEALSDSPTVDPAGVVGVHSLVRGKNVHAYITTKDADRKGRPRGAEALGARGPRSRDRVKTSPSGAAEAAFLCGIFLLGS